MTIASATSRISYTGDGVTTAFPVPFYFQANADLVVYLQDSSGNQTLQVLGTNYSLTGATLAAGGTCTFSTAPTAITGAVVSIYRDPPLTQTTSYNNNDPFPAKAHETALDKLTTIEQRTRDLANRAIHITDAESASTVTTLATVANRKNKLFGFGTSGELIYPLGPTYVAGTYTGVAEVDSRATAQVTTFPISVTVVRTGGLTTPGDGGGLDYIRGVSTSFNKFQDAGGVYWKPATLAPVDGKRAFPTGYIPIGNRVLHARRGAGPGRVTLAHDPLSYCTHRNYLLSAASSVVWVDDMNGNDANAGTSALPFKTLTYAGSTSTAQIVIVRKGHYVPPNINVTDAAFVGGRALKQFFLEPGVVVASAGPRLQDQAWTVHSGTVYKATLTLTGAQTVQRVVRRDLYESVANQPTALLQYATAAALVAATGVQGWAIDTTAGNKDIYIRLTNGDNVSTFKSILKAFYLDTTGQSRWMVTGVPCLIHGPGALFDGVGIVATDNGAGSLSEMYVDGVFSRYAPLSAFQCFGSYNFYKNCTAHAPLGDCFNYNAATTSAPAYVVEQDCRGTDAGDIATFGTGVAPNRNGSSAHDYVDVLRIGAYYEGNWGPQVADIANAATGTSWNIGVVCAQTTEPQSIGFYSADAGRVSYYDSCHAYGNTTAVSATGGASKSSDSIFDGTIVGTLTSYDPATGV